MKNAEEKFEEAIWGGTMADSLELLEKMGKFILKLIYGIDFAKEKGMGNYKEQIERSFEEVTTKLQALYGVEIKDDNRFFDIISDFAEIHDDVYFEAGFLTGIKLVKGLELACRNGGA